MLCYSYDWLQNTFPPLLLSQFPSQPFWACFVLFCSGHVFFSACWRIACYFRVLPSLLNFFFFGNSSWSVNFGMRSCGFRIVYLSFLVDCLSFRGFPQLALWPKRQRKYYSIWVRVQGFVLSPVWSGATVNCHQQLGDKAQKRR